MLDDFDSRKDEIRSRLKDFESVDRNNSERVFSELAFCLMTPQSKAVAADMAVKFMVRNNLLMNGSASELAVVLQRCGVRFPNNKAKFIVEARSKKLVFEREWLTKNIRGMGLKEASHFLRNIGVFGNAILDRHILKNLEKSGVIDRIPEKLDRKTYFDIEARFKDFAQSENLSIEEVDLLFWSREAGMVFK